MTKKIYLLALLFCLIANAVSAQSNSRPETILKKVLVKLESIKKISFSYSREINAKSENYLSKINGVAFLDFTSKDTIVNFRFQNQTPTGNLIFNGSEEINMNDSDTTIDITYKPKRRNIESSSFLANSPVSLRYGLPEILKRQDIKKSVRDTVINGKNYFLASITLINSVLGYLGNIVPITTELNISYQIVIDKISYLPFMVIQKNNQFQDDYTLTMFENYNNRPAEPDEYSWFASSYTDKYKPKKQVKIIAQGTVAPAWELPLVNSPGKISLEDLKGKVVLLEFWFKNCGPCIEAVPTLNTLKEKYSGQPFELVGINAEDGQKDALWFVQNRKVNYTTVYEGKEIAKLYGVPAYPTTVLLDRTGKVIYAGGFDKGKIGGMIDEQLIK